MTALVGDVRSIQQALRGLGWPLAVDGILGPRTRQAVRDFQHGYGPADLAVDGIAGVQTCKALNASIYFGGACSTHFTFREFKSTGDGWIKVNRTLVRGLETYRTLVARPVRIVSGYRDPARNRSAGGASKSQHLYGSAADVDELAPLGLVAALRVFSGIGVQRSNGLVRHVDVRGQDGAPVTTPGTPAKPTVWWY